MLADTTTGNISGTVTANGKPVPNVSVVAVAPSGRYTSTTDAKGFFSIVGVVPDTYNVSFTAANYSTATVNGVTVNATLTTTVDQQLSTQLKTIGSTTSRASGVSAFQPQQPVDTYSVNSQQINTILGKAHAVSETNLLIALPGASLDNNGYPVLRGGRENDEGFQFEGIDYTDAFTSQFVNSLALNGVSSFQLTPGAGDASVGNAGTGQINATVKRGTFPHFGSLEYDTQTPEQYNQYAGEYGFATPNGRWSSYTSIDEISQGIRYGRGGYDLNQIGRQISLYSEPGHDLVENLVYKFGPNQNQSIQGFYQNQLYRFFSNLNFTQHPTFRVGDAVYDHYFAAGLGLSTTDLASVAPLEYGQTSFCTNPATGCTKAQLLNRPAGNDIQPNDVVKLQYSNSINESTFLTAKLYKVNAVVTFDDPNDGVAAFGPGVTGDVFSLQGGVRTGGTIDITKQLGTKHLLGFGAKYEFLHPVDTFQSATLGLAFTSYLSAAPAEVYDFISPSAASTSPACAPPPPTPAVPNPPSPCGYLWGFLPNGAGPLPSYNQNPTLDRHDLSFYLNDQFQATDKLKFNGGVRVDTSSYGLPNANFGA
ncbi:MAG: carboxypeptidase regulatory-like domain-containing protein, partial [Candidatus Eremiobacteraeota bacterium]|nr:carboxypeptidase regulatory-like domain-containing protein [Candidatus Eremiobacteraeota bacterium]MBV9408537.1 carboxypeptidase regulatory-like domain-containing protein [Candidatus Eremiobacteraeota bacterium]